MYCNNYTNRYHNMHVDQYVYSETRATKISLIFFTLKIIWIDMSNVNITRWMQKSLTEVIMYFTVSTMCCTMMSCRYFNGFVSRLGVIQFTYCCIFHCLLSHLNLIFHLIYIWFNFWLTLLMKTYNLN